MNTERKANHTRRRVNKLHSNGGILRLGQNNQYLTLLMKNLPILYALLLCYSTIKWQLQLVPFSINILSYLSIDEIIMAPIRELPLLIVTASILSLIIGLLHLDASDPSSNSKPLITKRIVSIFLWFFYSITTLYFIRSVFKSAEKYDYDPAFTIDGAISIMAIVFAVALLIQQGKGKNINIIFIILILLYTDLGQTYRSLAKGENHYIQAFNLKNEQLVRSNSLLVGQTKNWIFTVDDSTNRVEIIATKDIHKMYFLEPGEETQTKQENGHLNKRSLGPKYEERTNSKANDTLRGK